MSFWYQALIRLSTCIHSEPVVTYLVASHVTSAPRPISLRICMNARDSGISMGHCLQLPAVFVFLRVLFMPSIAQGLA